MNDILPPALSQFSQGLERGSVIYLGPFVLESERGPHGQEAHVSGKDGDMFEDQSRHVLGQVDPKHPCFKSQLK